MKRWLSILFLLCSCSVIHRTEFKDDITLTLQYNAISCNCAQWSESRYNNQPDKREYFYLERAHNNLMNADTLYDGETFPLQIQVKGKTISKNGYPKNYNPAKGKGDPGMVFRYSEIKIIQIGDRKTSR